MANSSSFLHIQDPRNGSGQSSMEVLPQTDSDDGMLLQNGYRLDVNHAESYHGVGFNYGHWAQPEYCHNASYQGLPRPPPAASVDLDGQYSYHGSPNIDYPRNGQNNLNNVCGPHPPPPDVPNGGVGDRAPIMTEFADPLSQSVPDSSSSGTLAMESLKRLADRYLHDPGSRIETLHMGLSPSGGRLRVTIVFDMDV